MMMDVNANDYANFICNVIVKRIIRLDGPIMSDYDWSRIIVFNNIICRWKVTIIASLYAGCALIRCLTHTFEVQLKFRTLFHFLFSYIKINSWILLIKCRVRKYETDFLNLSRLKFKVRWSSNPNDLLRRRTELQNFFFHVFPSCIHDWAHAIDWAHARLCCSRHKSNMFSAGCKSASRRNLISTSTHMHL